MEETNSANMQWKQNLSATLSPIEKKADVRRETKDDYINVARAELEPVMYGENNLNEVIFTVVNALQNISKEKFYGITILTEVLMGIDSSRIYHNGLDRIPEFRALPNLPYETIKAVIEWMIQEHLILKTKCRYPVLHSTYEGLHYSEVITEKKLQELKKYLEEK